MRCVKKRVVTRRTALEEGFLTRTKHCGPTASHVAETSGDHAVNSLLSLRRHPFIFLALGGVPMVFVLTPLLRVGERSSTAQILYNHVTTFR
jgi:hypothetical protein